jgi:catechol 2,3-dioxygenase-like lactoylglutathione lyase family enzyme
MQIQRLQHASVPRPPGKDAHAAAVHFYVDILGMTEIPKPRTFTYIEVSWFKHADDEIHVFALGPNEPVPHSNAHFCLIVNDVAATRRHLTGAGVRCDEAVPIPHRPRFYAYDPFGNQIEITAIEGDYNQ